MVFDWRNAPETRQNSFDPSPLNKPDHMKWFEQSLTNLNRCILIAELNKQPIGVLRYDFIESQAEISIYLDPKWVGKGLGTRILSVGTEWIKKHFTHIQTLQAKVIASNVASARAFEKAGFDVKVCENDSSIHYVIAIF